MATAISEVEKALPGYEGAEVGRDPDTDEIIYEQVGPAVRFRALADEYYQELEKELGNATPRGLYERSSAATDKD